MNLPKELRYAKTHEWVRIEDDLAVIGITDFAQEQLSDVTYVEMPAVNDQFLPGDEAAVIESVKAAADMYAPVSGTVVEINEELNDHPDLINRDPYGGGWIFKLAPDNLEDDLAELMSAEDYEASGPEEN